MGCRISMYDPDEINMDYLVDELECITTQVNLSSKTSVYDYQTWNTISIYFRPIADHYG